MRWSQANGIFPRNSTDRIPPIAPPKNTGRQSEREGDVKLDWTAAEQRHNGNMMPKQQGKRVSSFTLQKAESSGTRTKPPPDPRIPVTVPATNPDKR